MVALIIGLFTFKGQIFAVFKPSGFHRPDVHPSGAVLRRNIYWRWEILLWRFMGSGCRVRYAYKGEYSRRVSTS